MMEPVKMKMATADSLLVSCVVRREVTGSGPPVVCGPADCPVVVRRSSAAIAERRAGTQIRLFILQIHYIYTYIYIYSFSINSISRMAFIESAASPKHHDISFSMSQQVSAISAKRRIEAYRCVCVSTWRLLPVGCLHVLCATRFCETNKLVLDLYTELTATQVARQRSSDFFFPTFSFLELGNVFLFFLCMQRQSLCRSNDGGRVQRCPEGLYHCFISLELNLNPRNNLAQVVSLKC